jgi:hypothetical protein
MMLISADAHQAIGTLRWSFNPFNSSALHSVDRLPRRSVFHVASLRSADHIVAFSARTYTSSDSQKTNHNTGSALVEEAINSAEGRTFTKTSSFYTNGTYYGLR